MMNLKVQALTEQHCKEICSWIYPAPYDIYNLPSWGIMVAQDMQFADSDIRAAQFAAVVQIHEGNLENAEDRESSEDLENLEKLESSKSSDNSENSRISKIPQLAGELVGYVQFFPMQEVTRLGLGLRPDLCDKGLGLVYMDVIIKEAIFRNPTHEMDLEVHTWNERAQKTYAKAGFVKTDEYARMTPTGMGQFYCMVYKDEGIQ